MKYIDKQTGMIGDLVKTYIGESHMTVYVIRTQSGIIIETTNAMQYFLS